MIILFNKGYEKVKNFMKENYKFLLVYLFLLALILWPLPYYIYTGGGTIAINDRVKVENESKSEGSFHFAYVSELNATISTYLLSYIIPGWDLVPVDTMQLSEDESSQDIFVRDQMFLTDANQNAVKLAYEKAGKTFTITKTTNYVVYIMDEAKTDLKIGDAILACEGVEINDITDLQKIVKSKEVGDQVSVRIKRNNSEMNASFTVQDIEGEKLAGLSLMKEISYETDPKLTLSFSSNESGPSGGLLLAITIYDKLVDEDLTKGRKIVGTGTIDSEGNVGSIGGVEYKLRGAVSNKADLFIVPNGENYDDCVRLKEENHYDIEIVGVSTFEDAITYLEK